MPSRSGGREGRLLPVGGMAGCGGMPSSARFENRGDGKGVAMPSLRPEGRYARIIRTTGFHAQRTAVTSMYRCWHGLGETGMEPPRTSSISDRLPRSSTHRRRQMVIPCFCVVLGWLRHPGYRQSEHGSRRLGGTLEAEDGFPAHVSAAQGLLRVSRSCLSCSAVELRLPRAETHSSSASTGSAEPPDHHLSAIGFAATDHEQHRYLGVRVPPDLVADLLVPEVEFRAETSRLKRGVHYLSVTVDAVGDRGGHDLAGRRPHDGEVLAVWCDGDVVM